jgi:hypothetical protein
VELESIHRGPYRLTDRRRGNETRNEERRCEKEERRVKARRDNRTGDEARGE